MKSEGWAPLWFDGDSKNCQICVVQMAKKPGTLFLLYTLSTQGVPIPSHNFSGTGGTHKMKFVLVVESSEYQARKSK